MQGHGIMDMMQDVMALHRFSGPFVPSFVAAAIFHFLFILEYRSNGINKPLSYHWINLYIHIYTIMVCQLIYFGFAFNNTHFLNAMYFIFFWFYFSKENNVFTITNCMNKSWQKLWFEFFSIFIFSNMNFIFTFFNF